MPSPHFFVRATRRLRLEVIIHLSEFEKRRPLTLVKATHRLCLEVIIHLSGFEKRRPLTFLRRQRVDFA